jgi:hypothetical protein
MDCRESPEEGPERIAMEFTTNASATVELAIVESILRDRIVTLAESSPAAREALLDELSAVCEDSADGEEVREFWGIADGAAWRVHVESPSRVADCEGGRP